MPKGGWTPSPGHIVYASIPYSDIEKSKSRIAIVISSSAYNKQYQEIVVAFATRSSNIRYPRNYDVCISEKHPKFQETGLRENTTVRCGRLWTLDQRSVANIMGIVPDDLLIDIQKLVLQNFTTLT